MNYGWSEEMKEMRKLVYNKKRLSRDIHIEDELSGAGVVDRVAIVEFI